MVLQSKNLGCAADEELQEEGTQEEVEEVLLETEWYVCILCFRTLMEGSLFPSIVYCVSVCAVASARYLTVSRHGK